MAWNSLIPPWVRRQGRAVELGEIARRFKLTRARAMSEVKGLVHQGELLDNGGLFFAAPPRQCDREPAQAPPTQARIWKAACLADMKGGPWTVKAIARTANAGRDYVGDYLRWLAGQGHVIAQRRPGKETLYSLGQDAPGPGEPPIWVNRRNRKLRRRRKEQAMK